MTRRFWMTVASLVWAADIGLFSMAAVASYHSDRWVAIFAAALVGPCLIISLLFAREGGGSR